MIQFLISSLFYHMIPRSHLTVDGYRLAPYPGMTESDLDDFERWVDSL